MLALMLTYIPTNRLVFLCNGGEKNNTMQKSLLCLCVLCVCMYVRALAYFHFCICMNALCVCLHHGVSQVSLLLQMGELRESLNHVPQGGS